LKGVFQGLQKQHESDREELEVMWWLYNGFSDRLGKQVKATPPHLQQPRSALNWQIVLRPLRLLG